MQTKATVKYHLTSVRKTVLIESTNNKGWRERRKKGTLIHYRWDSKFGAVTVEK